MFRNRNRLSISRRPQLESMEARQLMAAHIVGSSIVYAKIQSAVNAASAGAIIDVDAGTYAEQVTINKSLTLRGTETGVDARSTTRTTNNRETILTGVTTTSGVNSALRIGASNVTIDGFTIQGQTTKSVDTSAAVILLPGVSGTRFVNNIVQNNVAGLYLANNSATNAAVIQYNVFRNNNNAGANGGRGIYTDGGISGGNLQNVLIDSNSFTNNRGGSGTTGLEAAVAFEAATAGKQSNFRVTNNTFANNGKSLLFFNTTGALIQGNTASGAADWYSGSFRFEGNNRDVTITYNNIINNPGPGVAVDSNGVPGSNSGFVINYNNITGNGTNSAYGSQKIGVAINQSVYDGTPDVRYNWWGSTTGPRGDGPGTGDGVYGNAYKTGNWIVSTGGRETFSPWSTSANPITAPTLLPAPSNLVASAASDTQISLSWTNGSNDATGIKIERSSDGLTFSPVTTIAGDQTSFADTNLTPGTKYYYRVRAANAAGDSAYSNITSASTTGVNPSTYLSDLPWVSATTGYGSVQKNFSVSGNTITLGGTGYAKGIGTHAVSTIVYNLAGSYTSFLSDVGVDSEVDGRGTAAIQFIVIGDGRTLYDSGVLTNGAVGHINVSVAGVKQLTLKAVNGIADNIDYDHADWANAMLLGTPSVPAAPAGLAATALASSSVKLTWSAGAASIVSYSVQRSADGVNFTTVATGISGAATGWTDPAALSPSTSYAYRITATNSVGTSPVSNVATVTTPAASTLTYLSDLVATSSTSGWNTVQKDRSIIGNVISLRGQTYDKGIGTHAISTMTYNLAGKYNTFLSDVGVDDEVKDIGSVIFRVIGDNGVVLFDSGVLTNNSPIVSINVNVTGVQTLTLIAKNGVPNDIDYDHADWANARLLTTTTTQPLIAAAGLTTTTTKKTATKSVAQQVLV